VSMLFFITVAGVLLLGDLVGEVAAGVRYSGCSTSICLFIYCSSSNSSINLINCSIDAASSVT